MLPSLVPGASSGCLPSLADLLHPSSYIPDFRILNTFSGLEKQHTEPQGATGVNRAQAPEGFRIGVCSNDLRSQ